MPRYYSEMQMIDIISVAGVFIILQIFDYFAITSYSQNLGYNYKYIPINFCRQICLLLVAISFIIDLYFSDSNNPPVWIIFVASLFISLYIYVMMNNLFASKPSDENQHIDE